MADAPALLLAAAALLVHAGLLFGAPLLAEIGDATVALLSGRTPPAPGSGWRRLWAWSRSGSGGVRWPPGALLAAAATCAASLLVPSFATGMVSAPLDDLPLVALLLVGGRLAGSCLSGGPLGLARALATTVPAVPALLLGALALSLVAGGTGLDAAIASAPNAAAVPLGLAVLSFALAGLADADDPSDEPGEGRGPVGALVCATGQLRAMVWLDLVAALLPPWSTTRATAGPADWLAALLIWPVKVGLLAVGAGVGRVLLGALRARWRPGAFRAASLLALLGGVFVLVGQTLE